MLALVKVGSALNINNTHSYLVEEVYAKHHKPNGNLLPHFPSCIEIETRDESFEKSISRSQKKV
jgi:hypothetical protein